MAILSLEERKEQLESNRYIDDIQVYTYEKELEELIKKNQFDLLHPVFKAVKPIVTIAHRSFQGKSFYL